MAPAAPRTSETWTAPSPEREPQIVSRTLTPAQSATRARLLEAARALAIEDGYDGVTVRKVAARAGLSAPTAYQYFSSKDHLLVDLMVESVGRATAAIAASPVVEAPSVEHAVAALRRAVRRIEREPALYVAMVRAYISGAPEVAHARAIMETAMRDWVAGALPVLETEDRAVALEILESVLFANLVGLVTGGRSPGDIGDALERAARALWK